MGGTELHMPSQNGDIIGVTEMWWDSSHGWSVVRGFCKISGTTSLINILDGPSRGDTQLDLLLTTKEELVGDMVINGSYGCSYHEMNSRPQGERGRQVVENRSWLDGKGHRFVVSGSYSSWRIVTSGALQDFIL